MTELANPASTAAALPIPVVVHLIAALISVALGAWQLFAPRGFVPRGNARHRWIGYAWVLAMALTALSSFFIKGRLGVEWLSGFSFIHGLSLWTLVSLVIAVEHARRRRIQAHQRWMRTTFVSLLVAGLFAALAPGRVLNTLVFTAAPQYLAGLML